MPDYKQSTVAGDSWVRCGRIVIENGPQSRAATFMEEQVIQIGTDRITRSIGCVVEPYTDDNMSEVFAVLDPETGAQTGQTATYAQLYAMLHSAYLHVAAKRDAAAEG